MTTKVKVTTTSKGRKSEKVNASNINLASVNVSAPAGAGVTAGGAGGALRVGAAGGRTGAKVRQTADSQLSASVVRESLDYMGLKSALAACFAAPEWDGAAGVRAALAPLGLGNDAINAAVAAAARKAGYDPAPLPCTVADVLALLHGRYAATFEAVIGAPASELTEETARVYDYDGTVIGTINEDATALQVVTDVLSFRNLVAARRAAAWSLAVANNQAVSSCWVAGRDCFEAGMNEAEAVALATSRVRAYYAAEAARRAAAETEAHNCRVDIDVLNVLLCDALAAGRAALADKIRGTRRKVLKRLATVSPAAVVDRTPAVLCS